MNTVIIVQARMTSTRLPGKVLKEVNGKPLLEYLVERLQRVNQADNIIIATTENRTDEPIIKVCDRLEVDYFRGSEEDVLARYYFAAKKYNAKHIVRITSDCPVIDPVVIDEVIRIYHSKNYDAVANGLIRTFPRGMDTEVFSFQCLEDAYFHADKPYEREHVTPYIYEHKEKYSIHNYPYPFDYSKYRWTVDTEEDFDLIKKIIESLYNNKPKFTLEDCIQLLKENPEWSKINAHIEQKKLGE